MTRGILETRPGERDGDSPPAWRKALTVHLVLMAALALGLVTAAAAGHPARGVPLAATSGFGGPKGSLVAAKGVSAGLLVTCGLTRGGAVRCWGGNDYGAIGDGTTEDRRTPVDVLNGAKAIGVGARHSCALTRAGSVKCWGLNDQRQLGEAPAIQYLRPIDISGLRSDIRAIAVGTLHSCALTSAGGVKCWGANGYGELGDGTRSSSHLTDVSGLSSGVTAIAAGTFRSCALTNAGAVKCWGGFPVPRGDGTFIYHLRPVDVSGLSGAATAISASCALTRAGGVECWNRAYEATAVPGLSRGVTAIASGDGLHSCGLTSAGGVKCWGDNEFGQLGDGTTNTSATPVNVSGLSRGVAAIAAGFGQSCAALRSGGVKCWGWNDFGQLGDATKRTSATPVNVIGFGAAKASVVVVSRMARVTPAHVAAVALRCGAQARCQGTLALIASVDGKLVGSSARRVRLVLARRTFSIATGGRQRLDVELTPRGYRLLVRVRRLAARAQVTYKQPTGALTTAARALTLRPAEAVKR